MSSNLKKLTDQLKSLNLQLDEKYDKRVYFPSDEIDREIDELENKAAAIISEKCNQELAPLKAKLDAAISSSKKLLEMKD